MNTQRTNSALFSLAVAAGALLAGPAMAQPTGLPTPTKSAAPAPIPHPGGSFENTAIASQEYDPTWVGWDFDPQTASGGSGIARNGAPILQQSASAPDGDYVAFVEGRGSIRTRVGVGPGMWRLRFKAAQRVASGVPDAQGLRVRVDGEKVFRQVLVDGTFADYFTDVFVATSAVNLLVEFHGLTGSQNVGLIDEVQVDPILPWNRPSTWGSGGSLPSSTDDVHIPPDAAVWLGGDCEAGSIDVTGDLLAAPQDVSLETRWLLVRTPGSSFTVGAESEPFAYDFQLTLNATDPTEDIGENGTKFLMAMNGGSIEMHGSPKTSWTKLTSISSDGTSIVVDDYTGWGGLDEIVIAFTGYIDHSGALHTAPKSQTRTIALINANGEISLTGGPLVAADHCTAPEAQYANGSSTAPVSWTLDQRAEVGMLTHNVRIVGTPTPAGFGGHVMLMACCPDMPPGSGRFSNVEFAGLGQDQVLGRYPVHWHMQRDSGAGQYVRDSSIHRSHNRAITIHGSHGVTAERNVCYDITGHAVFLEDGVERDNKIYENLVIATQKPPMDMEMLPHDNSFDAPQNRSPAAFWISHPDNEFIGNVAADSLGTGYWFALHRFPTGASSQCPWDVHFIDPTTNQPVNATRARLGKFERNVCHSSRMAVDLNDSVLDGASNGSETLGDPTDDQILPNIMWRPPAPVELVDFVAYGCTTGIYTGGGIEHVGDITFRDFKLADNGVHAQLASADTVADSLFVRDTGNGIIPAGLESHPFHGFESGNAYVVYDGPGNVFESHFVGYSGAGGDSVYFSNFGAARRHPNHQIRGLTFEGGGTPVVEFDNFGGVSQPATNPLHQPGVWGIAIYDQNGSLSRGLFPDHTLISNHEMMHLATNNGASPDRLLGLNAWLSPFHWGHLQVFFYSSLQNNGLLAGDVLPPVTVLRRTYLGWPRASFRETYFNTGGGPQMRQMPVIVRLASSADPECQYDLALEPTPNVRRVDVVIDNVKLGDVARLWITNETMPSWDPTVYLNDANATPQTGNILPPGASSTQTGYTRVVVAPGVYAIDLRTVNTGQTHRLSFTW